MNFRRSSSSSFSRNEGGKGGSGSGGGKPLSRWLSKTNALLEQITNAPGARTGEWEEEEARAEAEAERVRCPKCGIVFADKSMLKQHYVLVPRHNPAWTGKGPEFPASPPTPSSPLHSRSKSAASFGFAHEFRSEDDDGAEDHDLRSGEASPLTQTTADRSRFTSQFSELHPSFYEREVSIHQQNHETAAGGLGAKIVIGPGQGMTYRPNLQRQLQQDGSAKRPGQSHARTTSLSANPTSRSVAVGGAGSLPGPGMHGRSHSMNVISTSHGFAGFDDDFMGEQGPVQREPMQRSATEPAIHFDPIEEHAGEDHEADSLDEEEEEVPADEVEEGDDYWHERSHFTSGSISSTPPLEQHRRDSIDSIESTNTHLATSQRPVETPAPITPAGQDGLKAVPRPAPAVPSNKSSLASRPAPPPPPPSSSSLANRRPPAPPPNAAPAASAPVPVQQSQPEKKKRAAPPPPPPRRSVSAAMSAPSS
ncbi:hypothetical protein A4X09_0g5550 [Tilletia walkeri]|uniref:C2H2-type domain-containing protein n=1 Tax=Tilletia walkeri TaxID=117179 RepID=A0A8X7T3Y0_9BASI|nr:hypothetical protein A4X09_0g5550 [Tilletia walkeri]